MTTGQVDGIFEVSTSKPTEERIHVISENEQPNCLAGYVRTNTNSARWHFKPGEANLICNQSKITFLTLSTLLSTNLRSFRVLRKLCLLPPILNNTDQERTFAAAAPQNDKPHKHWNQDRTQKILPPVSDHIKNTSENIINCYESTCAESTRHNMVPIPVCVTLAVVQNTIRLHKLHTSCAHNGQTFLLQMVFTSVLDTLRYFRIL